MGDKETFIEKYLKGKDVLPDHYSYVLRLLKGPGYANADTCARSKLFSMACSKQNKFALQRDIGSIVVPEKLTMTDQQLGIYIRPERTGSTVQYCYVLFKDLLKFNFKVEDAPLQKSSKIYKILRLSNQDYSKDNDKETSDFVNNVLNESDEENGNVTSDNNFEMVTPGSTKKNPDSIKKTPDSTKKTPGSTKKTLGSIKKTPGSTKKTPGSTKKTPGSTKKTLDSTKKTLDSTKKTPDTSKKDVLESISESSKAESEENEISNEPTSPSATPKRRGRPPKKSMDTSTPAAKSRSPSATPKRRGRPPKKSMDTTTPADKSKSPSATPKRRGRPPKKSIDTSTPDAKSKSPSTTPSIITNNSDEAKNDFDNKFVDVQTFEKTQSPSEAPKRRGRPPKKLKLTSSTKSKSPEPKRRGRPPKKSMDTLAPAAKSISHLVPKKRGRPPKKHGAITEGGVALLGMPIDEDGMPIAKKRGRPPNVKRGPGRPRKSSSTIANKLTTVSGGVAKRGRGRPPKNLSTVPTQNMSKQKDLLEWAVPKYSGRGRRPVCKSIMITDADLLNSNGNEDSTEVITNDDIENETMTGDNDIETRTPSTKMPEKRHVSFGQVSSFRKEPSVTATHASKKLRVSKFDKYDGKIIAFADFKSNDDNDSTTITKYEGKLKYNGASDTCDILFENDNLHDDFTNVILSEVDEYIRISDFYQNSGMMKAYVGAIMCDEYYSFYSKTVNIMLTDKFGSFPIVFPYDKAKIDPLKAKLINVGNTLSLVEDNINECLQILSAELIACNSSNYFMKYQYLTYNEFSPWNQHIETCMTKVSNYEFLKLCDSNYVQQSKKEYEESQLSKVFINDLQYEVKDNWKSFLERFITLESN